MHRLFVALRPPVPVRDHLLDLMHGVEGARWQSDDQLHLTLRFIGEVDRHQASDIAAASPPASPSRTGRPGRISVISTTQVSRICTL